MAATFADKGRGPDSFDCWGLVKAVYSKHKGIELPSYDDIYQDTIKDCAAISANVIERTSNEWTPTDAPHEFDVVVLRMRGLPMHVGMVTKPDYMLHCHEGVGVSHERMTDARWVNRVLGFYRYDGQR